MSLQTNYTASQIIEGNDLNTTNAVVNVNQENITTLTEQVTTLTEQVETLEANIIPIPYNAATNTPALANMAQGQTYTVTTQGAVSVTISGATKSSGSYLCVGDQIFFNGTDYSLVIPDILNATILSQADFSSLNDMNNYINQRRFGVTVTWDILNSAFNETSSLTINHIDGANLFIVGGDDTQITFSTNGDVCVIYCNCQLDNFNVTANSSTMSALNVLGDITFQNSLSGTNTNSAGNGIYNNGDISSINLLNQDAAGSTNDIVTATGGASGNAYAAQNSTLLCYGLVTTQGTCLFGRNSSITITSGGITITDGILSGGDNNQVSISGVTDTGGGAVNLGTNNNFVVTANITTSGSGILFGFGVGNSFFFSGTSISANYTYNGSAGTTAYLNSLSAGTTLPVSTPSAGNPSSGFWRTA